MTEKKKQQAKTKHLLSCNPVSKDGSYKHSDVYSSSVFPLHRVILYYLLYRSGFFIRKYVMKNFPHDNIGFWQF